MTVLKSLAVWMAVFWLGLGLGFAQDATNRAGELKSWREQCNDPDPDLRLAYIEKAIDGGDVSVKRICIRLALESDNADIRNLGLRAAISSVPSVSFAVQIPGELEAATKAAGDDEKKLAEIARWYVSQDFTRLRNGLVFEIDGAAVSNGESVWYPLAGLSQRNDKYRGKTTVVGSELNWTGRASLAQPECSLNAKLLSDNTLSGTFQCGVEPSFPVTAKLL
ncbi:hypothetical protein [Rhizobium leguminosarum]|uniref:Uncharacterized protein n=1 Tax=Rhizobium leguminosarum TaxID=384 RepID=A0A7K3VLZ0_RHILE|nr:hypothetical protein [Rhizobium leguminosarum]NEK17161.1 hypothetical protein [Rhizobium leguminosarum]